MKLGGKKEKKKLRYDLYTPISFAQKGTEGMNTLDPIYKHEDGFAVLEFAVKVGQMYAWYQIVDTQANGGKGEVVKEDVKNTFNKFDW